MRKYGVIQKEKLSWDGRNGWFGGNALFSFFLIGKKMEAVAAGRPGRSIICWYPPSPSCLANGSAGLPACKSSLPGPFRFPIVAPRKVQVKSQFLDQWESTFPVEKASRGPNFLFPDEKWYSARPLPGPANFSLLSQLVQETIPRAWIKNRLNFMGFPFVLRTGSGKDFTFSQINFHHSMRIHGSRGTDIRYYERAPGRRSEDRGFGNFILRPKCPRRGPTLQIRSFFLPLGIKPPCSMSVMKTLWTWSFKNNWTFRLLIQSCKHYGSKSSSSLGPYAEPWLGFVPGSPSFDD